jgi:hypothetical protein
MNDLEKDDVELASQQVFNWVDLSKMSEISIPSFKALTCRT